MSQIPYRANLNSGHLPLVSQLHARTVIIPGRDQAYSQSLFASKEDDDRDRGIPQVFYCHDVMPSVEGLQSVGYKTAIQGVEGEVDFDDMFILRNQDEDLALYSPARNDHYVYFGDSWEAHPELPPVAPNISDGFVSIAYVQGRTFVFIYRKGCFEYNFESNEFDEVTLVGIDVEKLNGICAGSGFLIAWDDFTIYRSQAINTTDFTPDPSLGSGSSIPEEVRGKIVFCATINNGFIVYTTQNAVSASFSQNIRFPFIFKEVKGSAGIKTHRDVAWQDNIGEHYAWTEAGLQKVDKSTATIVFANITDFLTAKLYEDYDTATDTFVVTKTTTTLKTRLSVVAKRYLVVSYGLPTSQNYTFAIIYDLAYKRFGKVKITHRAVFELQLPRGFEGTGVAWEDLDDFLGAVDAPWTAFDDIAWEDIVSGEEEVEEQPRELIAFLQRNGVVKTLNFDSVHTGDAGVLILGKYQYVRNHWITLQQIILENVEQNYNYTLKLLSTIDGKNKYSVTTPYLAANSGTYREYLNTVQGLNQSLIAIGTFHLAMVSLLVTVEGRIL